MRLKIFGIHKITLVFLGLVPAFLWCVFHSSQILGHDRAASLVLVFGLAISIVFTSFFSRGFFGVRFGVLFFAGIVMGEAFCASMMERDFPKLAEALVLFGIGIGLFFWLENRVRSASLNPKLKWFEGKPKFMPQIKARIQVGETWVDGNVRAIDQNGFFVFLDDPQTVLSRKGVEFELKFKEAEVSGTAKLSAQFSGTHSGFGLQFLPKDLYHFSQYTALVERLKGEGL